MERIRNTLCYLRDSLLLFLLLLLLSSNVFAQERPFIWVKQSDRPMILDKIKHQEWAKNSYADFIKQLNQDIELHQSNPAEFLRGMPFDWEKGSPGEIPPFYLTYHIENGVHKDLDNGTKEEMANACKLIRYLQMGVDCGMAF